MGLFVYSLYTPAYPYFSLFTIYSTDVVLARFFQNPASTSVIIAAITTCQELEMCGVGRNMCTITFEIGGLSPSQIPEVD